MTTEQYIITFFGIDTKYYTDDFVGRCWEMAADEEYGSTGVCHRDSDNTQLDMR